MGGGGGGGGGAFFLRLLNTSFYSVHLNTNICWANKWRGGGGVWRGGGGKGENKGLTGLIGGHGVNG